MIDSILKGFDVWTDAQGVKSKGRVKSIENISLEGIARLRELILDFAIRGELVSQDENDEPASILLAKSLEEKNRRIEAGEIKKHKALDEITDDMIPFQLPSGWEWAWFADAYFFQEGPGIRNWQFRSEGIKLLNVQNIVNNKLILDNTDKYIDVKEYEEKYKHFTIQENDLLFASSGGSWGKSAFFTDPGYTVIVNTSTIRIHPYINESSRTYLKSFLDSNFFKNQMIEQLVGMQPNFGSTHLLKILVPIPPANEQFRIADKIAELMSICDRLEEEKTKNFSTHQNLVKSLLETLTRANDVDELQTAWAKLSEHFDTLFCTEDSIEQLRQALLELVIAGRFKTQNDTDTPASVTFVNIKEELAEKHGKEYLNKLKRDMSTIEPSNFHFPIPESWIWCELQDLAILFNGKAHEQFVDENGDYILVNSSFVSSEGKVAKFVSSQLTPLIKGNIAIVMSDVPGGKALVKCYLVGENDKYSLNQRIGGIDASSHIDIRYLFLVLNRNKYYLQYDDGKKQTNLKKIQILSCPVPLPPIEEQKRIVEKVYELFELFDSLKTKIERANEINQALSKSIVEVFA